MHLLSFHTQLQLCNIRKGKEQALSQLGCREKKNIFWSFWWEMSIFTQGFTRIRRRFQAGGFWIFKLGRRGPWGHTTQITLESPGSAGSQLVAQQWISSAKTEMFIYIGGFNCPHLSLHPQDGLLYMEGIWFAFCLSTRSVKMLTPGAQIGRTCSKWIREDPLCWLCPGAGSQPETSGNFRVFQDCRVISSTLTGLIHPLLSHTHPASHKWELSFPSSPHTCTPTCKIFSKIKI